mgnify:CR=1 FL=1
MASLNLSSGKKRGCGLVVDAVGIVLAIAGAVVTVMCSTKSADYALADLPLYLALVAVAVVLTVLGALAQGRDGVNPLVPTLCSAASVFALVHVGVKVIGARVILASGLFSWNASNKIGWGVFEVSVVATALLVLAALVLAIAAFLPAFKDDKAAA